MSDDTQKLVELQDLLGAVCEDTLSDAQAAQLQALLKRSCRARQEYLRAINLHGTLHWDLGGEQQPATLSNARQPIANSAVPCGDTLLTVPEQATPSAPSSSRFPAFLAQAIPSTVGDFSSGWPVAYLVATVVVGVGLLLGTLVHVSQPVQIAGETPPVTKGLTLPEHGMEFVGRITGMVDCQWADGSTEAFNGANIPLNRKYALTSGLMEITYSSGAKVILQGPATYEVESAASGFLSVGKLTARVENKVRSTEYGVRRAGEDGISQHPQSNSNPQSLISNPSLAPIPYPLFTIKTPTAIVTDLGTEFGVEVDQQGVTTSHVFRGSVRVQVANADGKASVPGRVLHENESARVDVRGDPTANNRIKVVELSANPVGFLREIPKRTTRMLDLVDVVAGGDGFSGRRNRGIDANTGRISDVHPDTADLVDTQGDYQYHRVEGAPLVDGVFIPDGSQGPVQIDSAGHTFPDCPTTNNWSYAYIWAGGNLPPIIAPRVSTILGGIDYSSPKHALLFVHANKGITFNLDAIRQANPGCEVLRFSAVAGNVETESQGGAAVSADIWVLVDGQVRFKRREFNSYSGVASISIAIRSNDRFLTLAATDAGNSHMCDQIIFGDPRLELARPKTTVNNTE